MTSITKKLILNLPRMGCGNWWVEITPFEADCIYYFGPFPNSREASEMCPDYVEKVMDQGFQRINAVIKRCYPAELTKDSERIEAG